MVTTMMQKVFETLPKPNVFIFPLDVTEQIRWDTKHLDGIYNILPDEIKIQICYNEKDGETCNVNNKKHGGNNEMSSASLVWEFMVRTTNIMKRTAALWGYDDSGMFLHDSVPIGYLFYPQLFTFKNVYLETFDHLQDTHGFVFYDQRLKLPESGSLQTHPNVFYACQLDTDKFNAAFARDVIHLLMDLV